MDYFMSDIHGAYNAYVKMKELVNFSENDTLHIIGDIFDGNDRNPEACLKILDDIIEHDNIELTLGEHEYFHIMRYLTEDEPEQQTLWDRALKNGKEKSVNTLVKYIDENLTKTEKDRYFDYLKECEVSKLCKIGQNYFYICHGAPIKYEEGDDIMDWQFDIVTSAIVFNENFLDAIKSDPNIEASDNMTEDNTFVICGHLPTRYVFDASKKMKDFYYPDKKEVNRQKIIRKKHKFALDCGCSGDTLGQINGNWTSNLAMIGIEENRFFVQYLL